MLHKHSMTPTGTKLPMKVMKGHNEKNNKNLNRNLMTMPMIIPQREEPSEKTNEHDCNEGTVEDTNENRVKESAPELNHNVFNDDSKETIHDLQRDETHTQNVTEQSNNIEDNATYTENTSEKEEVENENPNESGNWTGANLETLSQWIQISSLQIEILDIAIKYFRSIVRRNVLLGLVFSTASGSISVFQLNSQSQQLFLNIIFTIMSFSIAIFTGLIKIYQIQERLEEFIQIKQEWIGFSVVITAEVQLPVRQRKKAIDIITKNKNKYLDLLKRDLDIQNFIKSRAYKNLYHDKYKQEYLKNCERHKLLKEIWACADDTYFQKAYEKMEDGDIFQYESVSRHYTWCNCCFSLTDGMIEYIEKIYKYCMNYKDKYIGEKTALSNIILTVIMEEENHQRNKQMIELLNSIQQRYRKIVSEKNRNISKKEEFMFHL